MMMKSLILLIVILIALIEAQPIPYPKVSDSFLGANDTGVSLFPSYLGLKIHIRCYANVTSANRKGPIALFDSGLPFFSTAWVSVIPSVLENMPAWNISKACFIDRYGYGWSDSSKYPITTQDYVMRLRGSLQVAGLTGKYVLVGWSWGSIFVQTYSLTYPKDVVGIMTVDGTDSKWGFISSNQQAVITYTDIIRGYISLNNVGSLESLARADEISHAFGWFPSALVSTGFTECSIDATQDIFLNNKFLKAAIQEYNIMVVSSVMLNFTYALKGTTLKDLPYVNLFASHDQDWTNRQTYMASLSSNSMTLPVVPIDHFVPLTNPDVIISGLAALSNKISTNPAKIWGR
ncbi:hypothetical protein DFA_02363 [Cavenderia fasciculata]|uniref:AB hydrolase-1 domain-containing protein n=1 Tax=Cavenderia fasciculata TaxID=261658 RepID=F4PZ87_CACFS|nr:uncharacterized protein DFA_02363 [Cavenderia fasciculata]EGG19116.1 hypothetical protein DFA_02363 [Cavenderia fasciculata]|eukprot:XP_004366749.1 hypothetical protein DFA_02363 [Cavenderia fasciculata]